MSERPTRSDYTEQGVVSFSPSQKEKSERKGARLPSMSMGQWRQSDDVTRARWIEAMGPFLTNLVRARSSDPEIIEETVQDAWLSFVAGLEGSLAEKDDGFSLTAAMITIARRRTAEKFRGKEGAGRRLLIPTNVTGEARIQVASSMRDVAETALSIVTSKDDLRKLIATMGPQDVERLVFLSDRSTTYAEKAKVTGRSNGGLRVERHRLFADAQRILDPTTPPHVIDAIQSRGSVSRQERLKKRKEVKKKRFMLQPLTITDISIIALGFRIKGDVVSALNGVASAPPHEIFHSLEKRTVFPPDETETVIITRHMLTSLVRAQELIRRDSYTSIRPRLMAEDPEIFGLLDYLHQIDLASFSTSNGLEIVQKLFTNKFARKGILLERNPLMEAQAKKDAADLG